VLAYVNELLKLAELMVYVPTWKKLFVKALMSEVVGADEKKPKRTMPEVKSVPLLVSNEVLSKANVAAFETSGRARAAARRSNCFFIFDLR